MKIAIAFIAACSFATLISAAQPWGQNVLLGPGKMQASCRDLERFGLGDFDSIDLVFGVPKSQWDKNMVSFVGAAAYDCGELLKKLLKEQSSLTSSEHLGIFNMVSMIDKKAQNIGAENEVRSKTEIATKVAQEENIKRAKAAQLSTCESSANHQLFLTQTIVLNSIDDLTGFREAQARERRIARESGVRNLLIERQNGAGIVAASDNFKEAWAQYKSLGGKAASPQKLSRSQNDPCESIR